jgi:L,D-transpeptidase-like protein
VLDLAMQAYQCGQREGRFDRPVLTIIDYSLPSSEPRLWVIDVQRKQLLHHELVAHGEGSGDTMAVAFSNKMGSHQSSLGLFRTDEAYTGRFGYSLRLSGLEPGVNDKARERAIVVHGFPDVSRPFAAQWGTIARTWGCPAVPEDVAPQIIDSIAGGSAVFAYYPDTEWLRESHYLHCGVQLAGTTGGN